ncbi:hypothetical protein [Streptomyces parvus]|uniref:hypothetical protein n=1 Tax=Streptomyces parvus TaxID=66428 RepID=UPI002101143E|nr:hypothetical protein [Streptomyces parvus]MCQ1577108.1 hypothetical protein [Streptomyces parvus]
MAEKEHSLSENRVRRIGREVHAVCPQFDPEAFARDVVGDLPRLGLKDRIARTSQGLSTYLPVGGLQAVDILLRSLPPSPEEAGITNDFGFYIYAPHSRFVAEHCRTGEDLERALDALRRLTSYFSAEDSMRFFITDFPTKTFKVIESWTGDPDHRVRRLASECTRPRLPWSARIPVDLDAGVPIIGRLYGDDSRFVTQSVANHLSDIAEDDLPLVLDILGRWRAEGHAAEKEFGFIAREALASRLKKGDAAAYDFLGYPSDPPVELSPLRLESNHLRIGERLVFAVDLTATGAAKLRVNYMLSSPTRTGKRRVKAYVLKTTAVQAGQTIKLSKQHALTSTSTVTLAPGKYTLEIQVNGRPSAPAEFHVADV